jgi:Zn-dependent membrane protease YugP
MWFGWFDPMYLLFLLPGMLLGLWAQFRVKRAYAEASRVPAQSGYTGAETAHVLLESAGIHNIAIESVQGFFIAFPIIVITPLTLRIAS